jgi:hypothetical protein
MIPTFCKVFHFMIPEFISSSGSFSSDPVGRVDRTLLSGAEIDEEWSGY